MSKIDELKELADDVKANFDRTSYLLGIASAVIVIALMQAIG